MNSIKWTNNDRPEIASEWTVEEPVQGVFFLRSERSTKVLRGQIIALLLPLIDGRRSVGDLMYELTEIPGEKLIRALESLEQESVVTRGRLGEMARAESAYWRLTGADDASVALNRTTASCSVVTLGVERSSAIDETLAKAGIRITGDAHFRLIVARDVLDPRLATINQECLRASINWMLVRPFGERHWIGPLFIPGQTPCWECFSYWLRINGWSAERVVADWPVQTNATLTLAATQAARWLLTRSCEWMVGRMHEFDSRTIEFTEHPLLPSPTCPHCGPRSLQDADLHLTLSPITGVTARIQPMREWPGLAVYAGETSQTVGFDGAGRLYYCRSQVTFGVAGSSIDAKKVCLAEGVERYSVRFGGFERVITTTYRQLGEDAVLPAELTLESEHAEHSANEIMGWIPALSLISSQKRFVPAGLVYLCFNEQFSVDTNGCASGKTLEAATVSALLELIERDAVALWWYNRARRPGVDLTSFCSTRVQCVLDAAHSCNLRVEVLDITTDFEIPACVAVATGELPGIALGMAAHPDPERCVWRALAEMSVGVARLSSPPDGRHHWLEDSRLEELEHLIPRGAPARWVAAPDLNESNLLPIILGRIQRLGLDALRVDLTRPELGVPVVRTLVPGLRPLERCLAPGRLYDVPVKVGWLARPLSPEQMNPMQFSPLSRVGPSAATNVRRCGLSQMPDMR